MTICPCGTVLSSGNDGPLCFPCDRRERLDEVKQAQVEADGRRLGTRIRDVLEEHGSLTHRQIVQLTGADQQSVYKSLRRMIDANPPVVEQTGTLGGGKDWKGLIYGLRET